NHALGFASDYRDFSLPTTIVLDLGISQVRLLTNNPHKARALVDSGIEVLEQIPCEVAANAHSVAYLRTKKEKMGHAVALNEHPGTGYATDGHDDEVERFASIDAAISEVKAGRMVVVVDDEDRENEGDLVMAAELVTPDAISFMATHGRGLICLAMTDE